MVSYQSNKLLTSLSVTCYPVFRDRSEMSPSTLLVSRATCRREVGAFTLCLSSCQPASNFYFRVRSGLGRPSIDWLFGLSFELGASTPCLPFCQPFRSFFRSGPVSEGLRLIGLSAFLSAPGDLRRRGMLLIGDQVSVVN
jgi:hypothetical protein